MAKKQNRRSRPNATWVTVSLSDDLHGDVRALAVKQHKDWPTVVAEAMRLWVAEGQRAA
jgi:hypothetical protein